MECKALRGLTAIIFSGTFVDEDIIEGFKMLAARIYSEDWEVDARLRAVFDVSRDELIYIVREVVGARADAVEDDPVTAAGQFAYILGTRNVRGLFRSKGWLNFRQDNIESVRHRERDLKVIYQSVDIAASFEHLPRPISGKGAGSERLIDVACASLFSEEELSALSEKHVGGKDTGVWYFCVSVKGDDVRAEISLPTGIVGGNFKGFIERIFILRGGDWADIRVKDGSDADAVDFEPVITRK